MRSPNLACGKLLLAATAALTTILALAMSQAPLQAQQATGAGTSPTAPHEAPAPSVPPAAVQAPASGPANPPITTTLSDFAWLAGRWQGVWGPRMAQQVWMPPKAGAMLGVFQLAENDETLVIELYTLLEKPGGIGLYFRHFTPKLAPWETSGPTILNLVGVNPKAFVFENPMNGQPKRAVLRRVDADTYVSRSEIATEKGDLEIVEITYHRQKETPPSRH